MIVNTVQYANYIRISNSVVHLGSLPPAGQHTFVFHQIELLTDDRLFLTQGADDLADTPFPVLQYLDNQQPNWMGHRLEHLSRMYR